MNPSFSGVILRYGTVAGVKFGMNRCLQNGAYPSTSGVPAAAASFTRFSKSAFSHSMRVPV